MGTRDNAKTIDLSDVLPGEDIFGSEDDNGDGGEVCKRTQPAAESGAEAAEEGAGTENGGRSSSPCCCHRCSRGCNSNSDVVRLRGCWCKLRSDICSVFRLVMDSAWNDSNRERPDLAGATRALVT